ncbi:MAG: hypothetical protein BMS9Abin12_1227 [Acidimicrobiia bacterium]|nr:MAG: hypothetical protein BMS9Abin12_1227 [Acidimicrobiia bacterium]
MSVERVVSRRWWQYKRTWFFGVPLVLILGVVGLFLWGSSQPKPEGFAPTVTDQVGSPSAAQAAAVKETPIDEPTRYTVDARSKQEWILFDFNTGSVVDGDFSDAGWDIALQRTKLLTNSGVTNPSGLGGAYDLGEVLLEDAAPPETAAFSVDILGGEDEDVRENPAIGRWYKYSFIKHVVSVKPNTYLVRTGGDRDAMVQFDSYYCEDEEPACITFRYRLVPKVDVAVP